MGHFPSSRHSTWGFIEVEERTNDFFNGPTSALKRAPSPPESTAAAFSQYSEDP